MSLTKITCFIVILKWLQMKRFINTFKFKAFMEKRLIARHFVSNRNSLDEFIEGLNRFKRGLEISREKDYDLDFGLKLTLDKIKLDREAIEILNQALFELPKDLWFLLEYNNPTSGPGTSYKQILFNPSFLHKKGITAMADLDACVLDTEDSLGIINEFAERVIKDFVLYASGSRDKPVFLASYERNNNLRIIHELFHSLMIGSDRLMTGERRNNVTTAYSEIGESTTALTIINQYHNNYDELMGSVLRASQEVDMRGFATDYYTAIKSSTLGRVMSMYINFRGNRFYDQISEEEEFSNVRNMVYNQTHKLGETDIKDLMLDSLRKMANTERILEFYSTEDVVFVRDLMIDALRTT